MTTKQHEKMTRRLERQWMRAVRREESAVDLADGWRLAAASDRARRRLEMHRAGIEPQVPRTARNLARAGLHALAQLGRVIARSVQASAALARARVAKLVRSAGYVARQSMRRALRAVVKYATGCTHMTAVTYDRHDRPVCTRCGETLTTAQAYASVPVAAVVRAIEVMEQHQLAAEYDRAIDGGEFSGPAIMRAEQRAIRILADQYGLVDHRLLHDAAEAAVSARDYLEYQGEVS